MGMRYQLESLGPYRTALAGRFYPNGSSAVVATSNIGAYGWTVERVSTGLFKVTVSVPFVYLFGKFAKLSKATIADQEAKCGAESVSDRTFHIGIWDASDAALVDLNADAGTFIDFGATLKRSAASGKR